MFLNEPTFQACRPFSLLLSTSSAFSTLTKGNLDTLSAVVESTVNVSSSLGCESYLAGVGRDIKKGCAADMLKGNAVIAQALTGRSFSTPFSFIDNEY